MLYQADYLGWKIMGFINTSKSVCIQIVTTYLQLLTVRIPSRNKHTTNLN